MNIIGIYRLQHFLSNTGHYVIFIYSSFTAIEICCILRKWYGHFLSTSSSVMYEATRRRNLQSTQVNCLSKRNVVRSLQSLMTSLFVLPRFNCVDNREKRWRLINYHTILFSKQLFDSSWQIRSYTLSIRSDLTGRKNRFTACKRGQKFSDSTLQNEKFGVNSAVLKMERFSVIILISGFKTMTHNKYCFSHWDSIEPATF